MGRARVRVPHEQGLTCTNALTCLHLVYTEHTPVAHVQFYGGLTADRCCCPDSPNKLGSVTSVVVGVESKEKGFMPCGHME